MAQMYNENTHLGHDGKTNLYRFIESISKYCDALVMYDDCSTDNSVEQLEIWNYSNPHSKIETHIICGEQNQFDAEMSHKALALDKCRQIGSDWVLWLDVDEVIESRGEQGALRELCVDAKKEAVNLYNINLWRTDRYFRVDELWAVGLFCRLWKMTDRLHYKPIGGLHQDLVPLGIQGRETKDLRVIHYGFATDKNILRKYHTYREHGQKGRPLRRLVDESSIRLAEANPAWFSDGGWPYGPGLELFNKRLVELL